MAYIREFMTKEEKEWFEAKKIPNPTSFGASIIHASVWTIDRERETFLIRIGSIPEETDVYFYFFWESRSFIVLMSKEINDNELIWHLLNIKPLEHIEFDQMKMKTDLGKAMITFGLFGHPELEKTNDLKTIARF